MSNTVYLTTVFYVVYGIFLPDMSNTAYLTTVFYVVYGIFLSDIIFLPDMSYTAYLTTVFYSISLGAKTWAHAVLIETLENNANSNNRIRQPKQDMSLRRFSISKIEF